MKKRDFLAGMCCGFFIARGVFARVDELNLSNVSQIITVAVVVFALSSLWEWIKNASTKNTIRSIAIRRLPKYS
jgi:hypothetical protein